MRYIEISKKLEETLKACPQCGQKIERISRGTFECETCGLRIELSKQSTRYMAWGMIAAIAAFAVALFVVELIGA
jgi:tRNA(Ile2) C34 agmatinyltransferase TiaS